MPARRFNLKKTDRKKQDILAKSIRNGLPLSGLFAALSLTGGCGESIQSHALTGRTVSAAESRQQVIRGDVAPVENAPNANTGNLKRESVPNISSTRGVFPPPAEELPKETEAYTVKSGDTLWKIARFCKTPLEVLKRLNNFSDDQAKKLHVGQRIVIPKQNTRQNEAVSPLSPMEKSESRTREK